MSARSRFIRSIRRAYGRLDTETFIVEPDGANLSFIGLFEMIEGSGVEMPDGTRTEEIAEISFLEADFGPSQIKDGTLIYRQQEGSNWYVEGDVSSDGIAGEGIIKVTRSRRSRTGAY